MAVWPHRLTQGRRAAHLGGLTQGQWAAHLGGLATASETKQAAGIRNKTKRNELDDDLVTAWQTKW